MTTSRTVALTLDRLKQLLHYEPITGVLTWKVRPNNRIKVGQVAGSVDPKGYRHVGIDGVVYRAHRLIWFLEHSSWPVDELDHINGVADFNRVTNLREATHQQNGKNLKIYRTNTSGIPGVSWYKPTSKWCAYIHSNGKQVRLGYFNTKEEAASVRAAAEVEHFKDFRRVRHD